MANINYNVTTELLNKLIQKIKRENIYKDGELWFISQTDDKVKIVGPMNYLPKDYFLENGFPQHSINYADVMLDKAKREGGIVIIITSLIGDDEQVDVAYMNKI